MDEQTNTQTIQTSEVKMSKPQVLVASLLGILVVIVGLQAFQIRSLTQAVQKGSLAAPVASQQGASSLFQNLKSTVGGCGG